VCGYRFQRLRKRQLRLAVALLVTYALVACAEREIRAQAQAYESVEPIGELLDYADAAASFSEADWSEEWERLTILAPEDRPAADLLRLALLHLSNASRSVDPAVVEASLRALLADQAEIRPEYVSLARLLLASVSLQPAQTDPVVPELSSRPDAANPELSSIRAELADERAMRMELQAQLDALRRLEDQLNDRALMEADDGGR